MGNSSSSTRQRHQQPPSGPVAYPPAPVYTPQQPAGYHYNAYGGQYYGNYGGAQHYGAQPQGAAPPQHQPYQYPGAAQAPRTQEYQRTATIRNQVNLKKQTLKLVQASADTYAIHFTFDASAPCRVITSFLSREDTKRSCKIVGSVPPGPAVHYEKGLEQKFPPEDEGLASQHSLDLLKHPLRDLLAASSNQGGQGGQQGQGQPQGDATVFPLIIRLEALTDEGRTENRSLASLAPGAELPQWVQSQTTYARIVREDDGSLGVRVIKQKIWVKGESYELQEIYGMEQNRGVAIGTPAAGPADGFEDVEGNECVICMSAPRDTAALPCRHMCMCHGCASALKTQTNKCPICRNEIESLLHIKINKGTPATQSS